MLTETGFDRGNTGPTTDGVDRLAVARLDGAEDAGEEVPDDGAGRSPSAAGCAADVGGVAACT
ncbi:hypothetical protein GCM10011492_27660 [Flexivirga endophytica]|uniref:Uncharacterized protein n=1 Tax=Flexivirga endophytica TaxID=1849103 RepID=A0A916WVA3_9MICO|nr:hypothetical protein GCM10011492_27660 [Flexivirga endophytica]GHB43207.1 hypothetical protein GCM10008112_10040 [Flexivirga endophytica]